MPLPPEPIREAMAGKHSPDTILEEALKILDLQARGAYLDEVCGDNEALRHEVGSLLAAHFAAEGFMDTAADQVWLPQTEKEGDWIGRYRL